MAWPMPKEEFDPKCIVPIVKRADENVKCWDCFSTAGIDTLVFINGNMTSNIYRDILEKNLFELVTKNRIWTINRYLKMTMVQSIVRLL